MAKYRIVKTITSLGKERYEIHKKGLTTFFFWICVERFSNLVGAINYITLSEEKVVIRKVVYEYKYD